MGLAFACQHAGCPFAEGFGGGGVGEKAQLDAACLGENPCVISLSVSCHQFDDN